MDNFDVSMNISLSWKCFLTELTGPWTLHEMDLILVTFTGKLGSKKITYYIQGVSNKCKIYGLLTK